MLYRTHHAGTGLDILKVQRISQAQAWQRAGRAGREADGICHRVYTKTVSLRFGISYLFYLFPYNILILSIL